VWNIDIRGNQVISDQEILRGLYKFGVYEGCHKGDVDIKSLTRDYMLSDDRLSFMHMNINGINATVEVAEAVKKTENTNDKKEVCNIVARCDGVIVRMDVYSGGREVENGQSVVKGQLLISSFFETRTVGHLLRRAKGTVFAITEPVFEMRIPKSKFVESKSETKTKRSASFLNYSLPLDGENAVFGEKKVQLETKQTPLYLFGALKMPITLVLENYNYFDYSCCELSLQEARSIYEKEYARWKKSFSENAQILSYDEKMYEEDGCFVFVSRHSCIESIGIDKPFEIREN
jgi:similar to stage IV sporulation protein